MNILEKVSKENYPKYKNKDIENEIIEWLHSNTEIDTNGLTKQEMIFLIRNKYTKNPKCYCGNIIQFKYNKYRKYCSSKCAANDSNTLKKRIHTVNKKYGCENVFQNSTVKEKIESTNIKKYGTKNPYKFGSDKSSNALMDLYGVNNCSKLDWVNNKKRKHIFNSTYEGLNRFSTSVIPNFSKEEYIGCGYDKEYSWHCMICDKDFTSWYHNGCIPKCTHCIRNSKFQDELEEYITSLGINYTTNTRTIIDNYEIDIFINDYNIGIECNGNYWHTESNGKDKNYHLNKTKLCNEKNIKLIHIFEDEWVYKKKIVKSRIKHLLSQHKYKIYGRKCNIKMVDSNTANKFLNKYHIQGSDKSSIRLGAYYNNKLVALMTFGARRFDKIDGYELIRYVTISKFSCIGVASKLLTHFERIYSPNSIISYADLRWSDGNLYKKLGFKHKHNSTPSFYYVKGNFLNRRNRIGYQKHKLSKKLDIFDENKSEWENMKVNGFDRIWDCGNIVFEKHLN